MLIARCTHFSSMSIRTAVGSETSGGHPETALGFCNDERLGRAEQSKASTHRQPSPKSGESVIIESISSPPNF